MKASDRLDLSDAHDIEYYTDCKYRGRITEKQCIRCCRFFMNFSTESPARLCVPSLGEPEDKYPESYLKKEVR